MIISQPANPIQPAQAPLLVLDVLAAVVAISCSFPSRTIARKTIRNRADGSIATGAGTSPHPGDKLLVFKPSEA
jgi:hypothetical protein